MALQGFDEAFYLGAKLARLQDEDPETWGDYTTDSLKAFLTKEGLTPEMHYSRYGYAEGLSPNAYFNRDEYVRAKAAQMVANREAATVSSGMEAFEAAWTDDMYGHYLAYGAMEGIDPSDAFDESAYLTAKLAQLQRTDPANWTGATIANVRAAIIDEGITPLTHYMNYAAAEGIDGSYIVPDDDGEGHEFYLTTGQDTFTQAMTTTGNDTFYADLVQVGDDRVETLVTGDDIDGGEGDDTLLAQVAVTKYTDGCIHLPIEPAINDVETIRLQALKFDMDSVSKVAWVNATNFSGVNEIWSWFSDYGLDIDGLDTSGFDDLVIGMGYTGSCGMHVGVNPALATGSQAIYYLLDRDADMRNTDVDGDGAKDLLAHINVNGVRFSVDGGAAQVLEFDPSLLTDGTVTDHETFVAQLQDALAAAIFEGTLPADTTLAVDYSRRDFTELDNGGGSDGIPGIVLSTHTDAVIGAVGFTRVQDLPGEYDVYSRLDSDDMPTSIQAALENVGRGGEGGSLIIEPATDKGIEDLYVTVYGDASCPSSLGRVACIDSSGLEYSFVMERLFLTSDNQGYPTDTYADLAIGNSHTPIRNSYYMEEYTAVVPNMALIQSNGFMGNLSLGTADQALLGLGVLNTADMSGSTTYFGEYHGWQTETAVVTTGAGADDLHINLKGGYGSPIPALTIASNGGDDVVSISLPESVAQVDVSQTNMLALNSLYILAGDGDDQVKLFDNYNFTINGGDGSDFVTIDADATFGSGSVTINDSTGAASFANRAFNQAELTLTFGGLESTVTIQTCSANNLAATQEDINNAVIEAIAASPELSRLLSATPGPDSRTLTITSLVDGANPISIDVSLPGASGYTGALVHNVLDATIGTNSVGGACVNFSHINMGSGANDLLVLDSAAASANVLVIDQPFGKVSLVNYFSTDAMDSDTGGLHMVDFTHYLDNLVNDGTLSAVDVTLNKNHEGSAVANSVTTITDAAFTTTDTFAGLTGAALLAALEGTTPYAGMDDVTLDPVAGTANLAGNVQDHIVMVENSGNLGEYKVFYLTSRVDAETGTTDGDFDAATLLGTIDFGASTDLPLWGNQNDMANYYHQIELADVAGSEDAYTIDSALAAHAAGTLSRPYAITDSLVAMVDEATGDVPGSSVMPDAYQLTVNGASVAFTDLSDTANATAIDFLDRVSLSAADFTYAFNTKGLSTTQDDVLTVDASAETGPVTIDGSGQAASLKITCSDHGDHIWSGDNWDTLTAGAGNDVFTYTRFHEGVGRDTIIDFNAEGSDKIELARQWLFLGGTALGDSSYIGNMGSIPKYFSGSDVHTFLNDHSFLAPGRYWLLFLDRDGTDAGLYYAIGQVGSVPVAGTGTTSTASTLAVTQGSIRVLAITGSEHQITGNDIVLV